VDAISGCHIPVETEETRPLVLGTTSPERETWDLRPLWTMYNQDRLLGRQVDLGETMPLTAAPAGNVSTAFLLRTRSAFL
jgi:hypothetical protein